MQWHHAISFVAIKVQTANYSQFVCAFHPDTFVLFLQQTVVMLVEGLILKTFLLSFYSEKNSLFIISVSSFCYFKKSYLRHDIK
jgi:hypothetical protein